LNRYFASLFIAVIVHVVLLLMIVLFIDKIPNNENRVIPKKIRIFLKDVNKIKKSTNPQKVKTTIKKQQKKTKRTINPQKKDKSTKIQKKYRKYKSKNINQVSKTTKIKKTKKQKPIVSKQIVEKKTKPIDPMSWLYEDRSKDEQQTKQSVKTANQTAINQNIRELYGAKFDKLSLNQQQYILDNQEIMRRITQKVLNRVASVNLKSNMHVNTYNVVEFYLHPNGDISDFKFLTKSGYFELDDTTKETIEYAYSQYPRPKEKTLIRYNVFFNL